MKQQQSSSFDLLDTKVQQWVWKQGWTSLKEIQENSIPPILDGNCDVIISAATAGGKTEAVFLPILTNLLKYCIIMWESVRKVNRINNEKLKISITQDFRIIKIMNTSDNIFCHHLSFCFSSPYTRPTWDKIIFRIQPR